MRAANLTTDATNTASAANKTQIFKNTIGSLAAVNDYYQVFQVFPASLEIDVRWDVFKIGSLEPEAVAAP